MAPLKRITKKNPQHQHHGVKSLVNCLVLGSTQYVMMNENQRFISRFPYIFRAYTIPDFGLSMIGDGKHGCILYVCIVVKYDFLLFMTSYSVARREEDARLKAMKRAQRKSVIVAKYI